jgi:hypothetical protein
MKSAYCLFSGPGPGNGEVLAVQDSFGAQYQSSAFNRLPGEILEVEVPRPENLKRGITATGGFVVRYKILRPVSRQIVQDVLRSAGRGDLDVRIANWYEVHGD